MQHASTQTAVPATLSEEEFRKFQQLIYQAAGISMSSAKRALVSGRLAKRVKHYGLSSFGAYHALLTSGDNEAELQTAVDLLTTNETYFFREPKHFDYVRRAVQERARIGGERLRIWSAACSTGEEPYSLAMTLSESLALSSWEIVASDISASVLKTAAAGHYPMARAERLPRELLTRWCLRGTGGQEGTFLVKRELRDRITFTQMNLNAALPDIGTFDFVFLRNVLIYFDLATKSQVVERVASTLRPDGVLIVGHSESLNGVTSTLKPIAPSIYRRTE